MELILIALIALFLLGAASLILGGIFLVLKLALVGIFVGAVARFFMPGNDDIGLGLTMALGLAGSMLASILGKMLNIYASGQSAGLIGSLIGAVLILGLYRMSKSGK